MKSHTEYMTFNTEERREFIRITENVQGAVDASGVVVSRIHAPHDRPCGCAIDDSAIAITGDVVPGLLGH